jgi:putative transposase
LHLRPVITKRGAASNRTRHPPSTNPSVSAKRRRLEIRHPLRDNEQPNRPCRVENLGQHDADRVRLRESLGRARPALKNVGHRVGRSTIARILKAAGVPPVPERPTSWQTFLRAHWGAIAGADFFTTEVWTWRGLVTYYTVFVIDLASRRVQIAGSTPHPDERFMQQVVRTMTVADEGLLVQHRVLICDRDTRWSTPARAWLSEIGIRVVQTPYHAPTANAYAERFVRSINEECLDRLIPIGERHFRRAVTEYVAHYHHERNHQEIANALIAAAPATSALGPIRRRPRLGGVLNYYERAA